MSRPRSTDPSVALSIAVPQSLKTRLDQELSYTQSRSKWVCNAIQAKIDAHDDESQVISSISNNRLLALCFNRKLIDYDLWVALTTNLRVAETGEEQ